MVSVITYHSDGTISSSELPSEEEQKKQLDEKFNDTIWKHKVLDYKIRVYNHLFHETSNLYTYSGYEEVAFDKEGSYQLLSLVDFELIYERVGKCKYTTKQLNKMKYEVEDVKVGNEA